MESRSKLSSNASFRNFHDSLAIIIPMFNEEKNCGRCIDRVIKEICKLHIPGILIVINDGSTDLTEKILKDKQNQYKKNLVAITHPKNRGYGAATQTGIKEALKRNTTWILHMDSDLTNDPKYLKDFLIAASPNIDCIKASRYIKNAQVLNVAKFRRIVSIIGNHIASLSFRVGIHDCTNGFRMVRASTMKGLKFRENNFSIILEEFYYLKKNHATFTEIPYILTARTTTASHFRYKPKIFYDYGKYVIKSFFIF